MSFNLVNLKIFTKNLKGVTRRGLKIRHKFTIFIARQYKNFCSQACVGYVDRVYGEQEQKFHRSIIKYV